MGAVNQSSPFNRSGTKVKFKAGLDGQQYPSLTADPAGLGANDAGFQFYRSDLNVFKYWTGSTFETFKSSIFVDSLQTSYDGGNTITLVDGTPVELNASAVTASNAALRVVNGVGGTRMQINGATGDITIGMESGDTEAKLISNIANGVGPRAGILFENTNQIADSNVGGLPVAVPFKFTNGAGNVLAYIAQDVNISGSGIEGHGVAVAPSSNVTMNAFGAFTVDLDAIAPGTGLGFGAIGEYLTTNGVFIHVNSTGPGSRHITIGNTAYNGASTEVLPAWILLGGERRIAYNRSDIDQPGFEIQQNNTVNNPVALDLTGNLGTGNDINSTNWFISKAGNLHLSASGTPSAKLDIVVGNNDNIVGLEVNQNDTVNNLDAIVINNTGSGFDIISTNGFWSVDNAGKASLMSIVNEGSFQVSVGLANTATYNVSSNEYVIASKYSLTGTQTINLPDATTNVGRILVIKDADGNASVNNIIIDGVGGQTIDGALTQAINTNYGSLTLVSDGSNWLII